MNNLLILRRYLYMNRINLAVTTILWCFQFLVRAITTLNQHKITSIAIPLNLVTYLRVAISYTNILSMLYLAFTSCFLLLTQYPQTLRIVQTWVIPMVLLLLFAIFIYSKTKLELNGKDTTHTVESRKQDK